MIRTTIGKYTIYWKIDNDDKYVPRQIEDRGQIDNVTNEYVTGKQHRQEIAACVGTVIVKVLPMLAGYFEP